MSKMKSSRLFRAISLVLIVTFISLDISYAYPPEHDAGNSTLATPSVLQQVPVSEHAARFQQSVFSQGALIASVYDIGEYFFGNADKGIGSLPSKYAEGAINMDFGKHLSGANIEILNIVPVEYIKQTTPEKLKTALEEIGFKGTLPDEGVVFILYKKDGKKFLVQIARKDQVSPDNLPGYEWVVSDKYVVKYMPEGYRALQGEVLSLPKDVGEDNRSSLEGESVVTSPVIVRPAEQAEAISTEPIAQVESPAPKAGDAQAKPFSIKAILNSLSGKMYSFEPFSIIFASVGALSILSTVKDWVCAHPYLTVAIVIFLVVAHSVGKAARIDMAIGEKTVPNLLKALKNEDWEVRKSAIVALGDSKEKMAVMPLIAILKNRTSEHKYNRAHVAESLGKIYDEERRAVEPLINAASDDAYEVRGAAIYALAEIGDKKATEPVVKILLNKDEKDNVRICAAYAFRKILDPRAVEPLMEILDNTRLDITLRMECARALGEQRDRRSVESLKNATTDKNEAISRFSKEALLSINATNVDKKSKDNDASTTLMSINPFAAIFGIVALGSMFFALKDFAVAHPIIGGMIAVSLITIAITTFLQYISKFRNFKNLEYIDFVATIGNFCGTLFFVTIPLLAIWYYIAPLFGIQTYDDTFQRVDKVFIAIPFLAYSYAVSYDAALFLISIVTGRRIGTNERRSTKNKREERSQQANLTAEAISQAIAQASKATQLFESAELPIIQKPAIPLSPEELKKGPWMQFTYHLDPSGKVISVEPGRLPSEKKDRLPGQSVRGEEYAFHLRLAAQTDRAALASLSELQERLKLIVPDGNKLYIPSVESFHIALAGRYADKKLGTLPDDLIAKTITMVGEQIGQTELGRFSIVISGARITNNGTIVLDLKEDLSLGRIRQNIFDAMKSSGWNESEIKINRAPDGKPGSGGIITLGRIAPNVTGNGTFMDWDEIQKIGQEISSINEELGAKPISADINVVSFLHPTREFLSEGWENEKTINIGEPITEFFPAGDEIAKIKKVAAKPATQLFEIVESARNEEKAKLVAADSAVGSLIVLARKAKRENQKLIIGLETDWIPGINVKNSLQRQAMTALMKEIDSIGETLRSMGLDSVEVIRDSGSQLADSLTKAAKDSNTNMRNIVVMASKETITSDSFRAFRDASEEDKPFLTGIDPAELIKLYEQFGESVSHQLHIRLASLLYMTLELAAGKEPPQSPIIVSYDKKMRILILLPKADPMDYETLKNNYAAEKTALASA